jgi:uncharacterized protein (DUF3084 family)
MSDHEQQQIADLTERLLATREQREDWAKFALEMQRERDAARQDIRTLTAERDEARQEFAEWLDASRKALDAHAEVVAERDAAREELATFHATMQTILDAKDALVVTARADRARLAACVERVRGACERADTYVDVDSILAAMGDT